MTDYRAEGVMVETDRAEVPDPHALRLMLADIVVAAVLASAVWALGAARFKDLTLPEPFVGLVLVVAAWVTILWANGAYRLRDRWSFQSDAQVVARSLAWLAVATFVFLYLFTLTDVSRLYLLVLFGLLLVATLAERAAMRRFTRDRTPASRKGS